jgi:hypothetical protein
VDIERLVQSRVGVKMIIDVRDADGGNDGGRDENDNLVYKLMVNITISIVIVGIGVSSESN